MGFYFWRGDDGYFYNPEQEADIGQSEAAKLAVARAMLAHDKSGPQNTFRRILRGGMLILVF